MRRRLALRTPAARRGTSRPLASHRDGVFLCRGVVLWLVAPAETVHHGILPAGSFSAGFAGALSTGMAAPWFRLRQGTDLARQRPNNDVVLQGPGVAPNHARGSSSKTAFGYIDNGTAPTYANGVLQPDERWCPSTSGRQFAQTVPLSHPATPMTMVAARLGAPGQLTSRPDNARRRMPRSSFSRPPSASHATVMMDRDGQDSGGSTSGHVRRRAACIPANGLQPVPDGSETASSPSVRSGARLAARPDHAGDARRGSAARLAAEPGRGRASVYQAVRAGAPRGAAGASQHRTVIGGAQPRGAPGRAISTFEPRQQDRPAPRSPRKRRIIVRGGNLFLGTSAAATARSSAASGSCRNNACRCRTARRSSLARCRWSSRSPTGKRVNVVVVGDQRASRGRAEAPHGRGVGPLPPGCHVTRQPGGDEGPADHVSFKALPGDMPGRCGPVRHRQDDAR